MKIEELTAEMFDGAYAQTGLTPISRAWARDEEGTAYACPLTAVCLAHGGALAPFMEEPIESYLGLSPSAIWGFVHGYDGVPSYWEEHRMDFYSSDAPEEFLAGRHYEYDTGYRLGTQLRTLHMQRGIYRI